MKLALALLLLGVGTAAAQPADCPPDPAGGGGGALPLALDIGGRPGVPKGTTGQVYVGVPIGSAGGMACTNRAPLPPADVLHGEPGDVLAGPPSHNLLRGPGTPVVEILPR